jgi:hypothetical protein
MVKSLCDHRKEGKNTCLEALKPVCRRVKALSAKLEKAASVACSQ